MRRILPAIVVALCLILPHSGRAQAPTHLDAAWSSGGPVVSFDYRAIFDGETLERMASGLAVTVMTRAWAYPDASNEPIAFGMRSCRVAYEVWDENYRVEIVDASGTRQLSLPDLSAVLARCGSASSMPLRSFRPIASGERIRFAALAEVDPVTSEMVTQIQRWVANPGDVSDDRSSESIFGEFVSLFVTPNVTESAREIRIESTHLVAP